MWTVVTILTMIAYTAALLWIVMLGVSYISGWRKLAQRFPANRPPGGERFAIQSASVGGISYNNCMTIYRDEYGLHFYVWFPFRAGHPPMLIPWTEMHRPVESSFLGMKFVTVDVGDPKVSRLQVAAKVFAPPNAGQ